MIVVVDDQRTLRDADVHLRTSEQALEWLALCDRAVDELWLDHDLGGEDTVRPVVLWLLERAFLGDKLRIGTVFVQSMNPVGAEWIEGSLSRLYPVRRAALTIGPEQPV